MMRLRVFWATVLVMCIFAAAGAQYRTSNPTGDTGEYLRSYPTVGVKGVRGLLDPARMHMSHNVSFGYASAGGRGYSEGLYVNNLEYRISRPLSITTHLGYRYRPTGISQWDRGSNGDFVGGAELDWRPTSSTTFRLSAYRGLLPYSPYPYYGLDPYDVGPFPGRP